MELRCVSPHVAEDVDSRIGSDRAVVRRSYDQGEDQAVRSLIQRA
jgi:hypothetical protein